MLDKSGEEKISWPYKEDLGIEKDQWEDLLKDKDIMKEKDIELLKVMYVLNVVYGCEWVGTPDLAELFHIDKRDYVVINGQAGRLGKRVAKKLGIPIPGRGWRVLFWGDGEGAVYWSLRPELKDAIRKRYFADEIHISEEIVVSIEKKLFEGARQQIYVNSYERNPAARERCIKYYGRKCVICGFKFEDVYGEVGRGVIHVHHLKPLHEIGETYSIDPIEDLRPVCPNCHVIIHRRNPPYSIDEVMAMIKGTGLEQ